MEFNGTFLVTIVSFLVFVFLMNKILYAPALSIMEERRKFIDDNFNNAQENDSKAEQLSEEKEEKLGKARNNAKGKYLISINDFKSQKADIIHDAQSSAEENLNNARAELENLSNEVKNGLKNRISELAGDISEKVIGYRNEINNVDNNTVDRVLWGE